MQVIETLDPHLVYREPNRLQGTPSFQVLKEEEIDPDDVNVLQYMPVKLQRESNIYDKLFHYLTNQNEGCIAHSNCIYIN